MLTPRYISDLDVYVYSAGEEEEGADQPINLNQPVNVDQPQPADNIN